MIGRVVHSTGGERRQTGARAEQEQFSIRLNRTKTWYNCRGGGVTNLDAWRVCDNGLRGRGTEHGTRARRANDATAGSHAEVRGHRHQCDHQRWQCA
eukprot:3577166-Prymnesium_polylepis.1